LQGVVGSKLQKIETASDPAPDRSVNDAGSATSVHYDHISSTVDSAPNAPSVVQGTIGNKLQKVETASDPAPNYSVGDVIAPASVHYSHISATVDTASGVPPEIQDAIDDKLQKIRTTSDPAPSTSISDAAAMSSQAHNNHISSTVDGGSGTSSQVVQQLVSNKLQTLETVNDPSPQASIGDSAVTTPVPGASDAVSTLPTRIVTPTALHIGAQSTLLSGMASNGVAPLYVTHWNQQDEVTHAAGGIWSDSFDALVGQSHAAQWESMSRTLDQQLGASDGPGALDEQHDQPLPSLVATGLDGHQHGLANRRAKPGSLSQIA
jgi:hypothetical protein